MAREDVIAAPPNTACATRKPISASADCAMAHPALAAAKAALEDLCLYPDGNGFELKRALSDRFGVDPGVGQAALEIIGAAAEQSLPEDPDYVSWGNKTAITLSALTPEFLFR